MKTEKKGTSNIFPIGSLVMFKTNIRSKPVLGKVGDFDIIRGGKIRYKIERKITGRFLDDIHGYIEGKASYVIDTRWCFFMWMKPDRIIRIIG